MKTYKLTFLPLSNRSPTASVEADSWAWLTNTIRFYKGRHGGPAPDAQCIAEFNANCVLSIEENSEVKDA